MLVEVCVHHLSVVTSTKLIETEPG